MSAYISFTDRERIKREGERKEIWWRAFTAIHFCSEDQERDRIKATRKTRGESSLSLQLHPLPFIKEPGEGLRHEVQVSGLYTA